MEKAHPLPSLSKPPFEEDPLTGLPNTYAFLLEAPEIVARTSGTVLLVDVDRQNSRNPPDSERKHAVTRQVAEILRQTACVAGSEGRLYRVGEDEFVVIIPSHSARGSRSDSRRPGASSGCGSALLSTGLPLSVTELSYPSEVRDAAEILDMAHRSCHLDPEKSPAATGTLSRRIRHTVYLLREALEMVYTDDISGLPNHRAALYFIRRALRDGAAKSSPVSLLLVDGDHLRLYNDNLGYQAGHELIRKLGTILTTKALPGESVARWLSGDEFMIVLPGVGRSEGFRRAQELCDSVARATARWVFPVTVSIGVASFPEDAATEADLIHKVEEANSTAKRDGKNRASYPPS